MVLLAPVVYPFRYGNVLVKKLPERGIFFFVRLPLQIFKPSFLVFPQNIPCLICRMNHGILSFFIIDQPVFRGQPIRKMYGQQRKHIAFGPYPADKDSLFCPRKTEKTRELMIFMLDKPTKFKQTENGRQMKHRQNRLSIPKSIHQKTVNPVRPILSVT